MRFDYQGVDEVGSAVEGWVEASDRANAVTVLVQRGHFATDLKTGGAAAADASEPSGQRQTATTFNFSSGRVSSKDVLMIVNQLAAALKAGLPLLNGLDIIQQQQDKPALKKLLTDLMEAVSSGDSLSGAMAKAPRTFKPLSQAMVRVGETGGILDQTVGQLSQLLRRDEQIKTNMKNASIYPAIVLSLGIISVVVMVTFILPRIVENVSGGAAALPLLTKVFLAMSGFLKSYGWLVLIGCIVIPYGFLRWVSTEAGRLAWDRFKLRIPVLGQVLVTVAVGRFARTLGALTKGGVTILESLAVVRDTLGNEILAREIDGVAEKVKTGQPLAEALSQSGTFPPLLIQITAVGEQTGQLDDLLLNAAETFDETADAAIARFMAIMPPMLILILAVLIGLIIAAALLPIFDMDLAGGF